MTAWIRRLALCVLLGGFAAVVTVDATAADDKKVPDVTTIMKKVNGNKKNPGLTTKVADAAKDDKWEDAQKFGKELKEMTEALGKNDAPKGEKDSWAKLSKQFGEQGAAIADAADKKDSKALTTALKTFKGACNTCHDAHK